MSQAEPKLKQKRRPRRNHAATVRDLALFCKVSIDVLTRLHVAHPSDGMHAQLLVYEEIAAKLEGKQ